MAGVALADEPDKGGLDADCAVFKDATKDEAFIAIMESLDYKLFLGSEGRHLLEQPDSFPVLPGTIVVLSQLIF